MERTKGVKNVMSEDKDSTPQDTQALTMPWIVLSNQIQFMQQTMIQRFEQMDKRIDDVQNTLSHRMDGIDKRIDDVQSTLSQRMDGIDKRLDGVDKRLDGMDKRLDGVENRLANRMNAWMAVMMVLTALLGFLLAHVKL